jgi:DnaA family protein
MMADLNKIMTSFSLSSQLLLPVREHSDATFETFYGEKNAKAKSVLVRCLDDLEESSVLMIGAEGVGKSHLMNAAMLYADKNLGVEVCYFSLNELNGLALSSDDLTSLFSSFEGHGVMALDHIGSWLTGDALDRNLKELCLFNLFNHYKMMGTMLLMASSLSIDALDIKLPDLCSRLKSSLIITLNSYDDDEKEAIMKDVASRKGFSLDEGVSTYIMKRSGRNLGELISSIDQLDKASLTEQRKLTIPFVKKVLNW